MASSGWRHVSGQRADINGLDAYVGTYQGSMQGLGNVVTLAAHIAHQRNVYVLAGLTPANSFEAAQPQFAQTIRSFRALSASEAERIRPNLIDLYTVRQGDTWEGIAKRTGGLVKPSTLAIMNHYQPGQPPRTGDRIKVVVEG